MLELWGMRDTLSLPLILSPLWPGEITPDRVLSIGQIEPFDSYCVYKQMTYATLNCLKIELVDHLTMCKQITDV